MPTPLALQQGNDMSLQVGEMPDSNPGLQVLQSGKYIVGHTEIRVFTCICLHLQKLFAKMQFFPSTLHTKLYSWEKLSTFKGKCEVIAENCIFNL